MSAPHTDAWALFTRLRAQCPYVAQVLGDQPTAHDLEVIRESHIPACEECSILYANYYLAQGEANRGAA